ncbi:MAG TPA: ATP-binding protein, partial [Candidatus Dormibacteraeota bacterium]|nr:ATP-binding protein [Candidatus Dormibacteraeota bacterium]
WIFDDKQTITLDGEWEFYPNQFLDPKSGNNVEADETKEFISVPGDWSGYLPKKAIPAYGYGTYKLKIILPDDDALYGIRMNGVRSAATIYKDGELISTFNQPTESAKKGSMLNGPFYTLFHAHNNEMELMLHVSNYEIPFWGGITKSVKIGTATAIHKESTHSKTLQMIVAAIFFLHAMYTFYRYSLRKDKSQKDLLYYAIMLTVAGFAILIDDDIVLQLPVQVETYFKILLFLFLSTLFFMLTFINHLFKVKSKFFRVLTVIFILIVIGELIIPFQHFFFLGIGIILFYILSLVYLFIHTIKAIRQGHSDVMYILLFLTSYTSNMVWGAGIKLGFDLPFYPFDFLIFIIVIALLMFRTYADIAQVNVEQLKELQIADEKKDEFLANTSHELRNPLHGIINITETILNDQTSALSSENRNNLKLLSRLGKQMTFTLNDILDISRLRDQKVQLNKENVDLHAVTAGVLDMVRFMSGEKKLSLHLAIHPTFPKVYADENRLIQILFNLIHNAVKFTYEGSVTINATHKNNLAIIGITDTGIGMDKQTQEVIFQRYKQADSSSTSVSSGIGLGLNICKQLIELHGGEITVASRIGQGSTFTFTIPLADVSSTKAENEKDLVAATLERDKTEFVENGLSPVSAIEKNDVKILVVDDDPVNLRVLVNILDINYDVTTATSGANALELLDSRTWDLVISDVMMPNMSGYELTRIIRKQFTISELPILLLTARNQGEDIYTGFQVGANDYISKPMDRLELQARVEALTTLKQSVSQQLRMEAAWLQAQIKPHFLYNTLNTIASLAEVDTAKMVKLLHEFGNYLQRSFDIRNTQSLIYLDDELDITRSYLYIEQARFGDKIQVDWKVHDDLLFKIPPLSIQPLVENAIRHGLLKRQKGGKVSIQITEHLDHYEISISDDGVGMSQDQIKQLLKEHPENMKGIGITNTNRRLKKLYGKGLSFISELNHGTIISFRIPK